MSNKWTITGAKMQAEQQAVPQASTRFKPGRSGNPTGKTATSAVHADLLAAFQAAHGRGPTSAEAVTLRTASRLAAKAQNARTNTEQATRAANTAMRFMKALGLAGPPSKAKPRVPSLSELLARHAAAKDGAG
jgi:hypothetical protein